MTSLVNNSQTPVDEVNETFRKMNLKGFRSFIQNETQSILPLPSGLSTSVVDCVKNLIADMPIQMRLIDRNTKKYSLIKTNANESDVPE